MEMTSQTVQSAAETSDLALQELLQYEKKNLRINRIKLGCALGCVALILVIALILSINVGKITKRVNEVSDVMTEAGESINVVAKNLNEINFDTLSASVQSFADTGTETVEQIKHATVGLDVMLKDVHESIQKLGSVDIDELNNGIKTLNSVLDPLAKFFHVLN